MARISERLRVSRKIGAIAESATLAVDAKAKALKAAGEHVISFGAGEPDFPTPANIVEAAVDACRDPASHKYTPAAGLPELREAIAAKTARDSDYACEPSHVLVTNGGKQAVYNAFQALLDPGDEVLLPAPYWTTYPESIALADGLPVVIPTTEVSGFRVAVEQLEAARTERTKALLFVSPSNPTGAVYPREEVEAIGRWADEHDIWVVTDEIYEHLTFGEHRFSSMPGVVPELVGNCIVVNGVAKTYAMTGWRVGWMIGPADIVIAATNLQSHSTSNVGNVSQRAALAAVSGDLSAVAEMRTAFERRGHAMHQMLAKIPGVTCLEPQGAFYCFPSFEGVLGRSIAGRTITSSLELCEVLLDQIKVALVPGEAFGAPGYARLSFALGDDDLGEGLERLTELLEVTATTLDPVATRVLITEQLAARGLDALRGAGLDVDERLGLTPAELLEAVAGAAALVIRSSTQVDAEVVDAGRDLVVIGRAGIGLDNVDVDAATRRGVMVVNAPQSNVLSAAEHTVALLLSQARNIPRADAELRAGTWNRSKWEGVELHGKTLGIIGLGRVGVLVAQRALAFGMKLLAFDPYVSAERARQLGLGLVGDLEELVREADFLTLHIPKTPETLGLIGAELLAHAKPTLRIVNTSRGGIIDEAALADAITAGRVAGAAIDVFATEPTTESPLFELDTVVVTPHLGASTVEAQDKAGITIAEQVILALRGEFVPYAVNVAATEANATVQPFLPLAERLGRLFTALAGGAVETLEVSYEGEIADYDCRVLTLSVLKGALSAVVDEPVSFVNAPQLAETRGMTIRESTTPAAIDYVNLVTLRGSLGDRNVHVSGTLFGKRSRPRIVGINEHDVDLPPSSHMLVVRNSDTPGMIGTVGFILGEAGVNIADMDVGVNAEGEAALMALSTYSAVPADVVERLRAVDGVLDANAIELD